MKFFIVRWSGDACDHNELFDDKCGCHTSNRVDDPIKFFNENQYGDDVVTDLAEMEVGQRYNVDELIQDIEIMRVEQKDLKLWLVDDEGFDESFDEFVYSNIEIEEK